MFWTSFSPSPSEGSAGSGASTPPSPPTLGRSALGGHRRGADELKLHVELEWTLDFQIFEDLALSEIYEKRFPNQS